MSDEPTDDIPEEEHEEIENLFVIDCWSIEELAETYGVPPTAIREILSLYLDLREYPEA